MTLEQALRLCDALEGLVRKGRRTAAESCVQLHRIEQMFLAAGLRDGHLDRQLAAAVLRIAEYLEAPLSHIKLRNLGECALTKVARLRAAVVLSYEAAEGEATGLRGHGQTALPVVRAPAALQPA